MSHAKLKPPADAVKNPTPNPLQNVISQLQNQLRISGGKEKVLNETISEQMNQYISAKMSINFFKDQVAQLQTQLDAMKKENAVLANMPLDDIQTELVSKMTALTAENERLTRVIHALDAEIGFMRKARGEANDGSIQEEAPQDIHEGSTTD